MNAAGQTSDLAWSGLDAGQKARAEMLMTYFENNSPTPVYNYAAELGDGRGITFGRAGFTTRTGDGLSVVADYTAHVAGNPLAKYLPALQHLADSDSPSTDGLDGFGAALAQASKDPLFQKIQDTHQTADSYVPAMAYAAQVGVTSALGKAILYDTLLQHGDGNDPDAVPALIARATDAAGGTPSTGVAESKWLATFLDVRQADLVNPAFAPTKAEWSASTGRLDVFRLLVASGDWNLSSPHDIQTQDYDFHLPGAAEGTAGTPGYGAGGGADLGSVISWGYQLQGLENPGAVKELATSPCDLVVIDPTDTVQGLEAFSSKAAVSNLHHAGKQVFAYLDVGQVETYRTYYSPETSALSVAPDPDGWSGNQVVKFWNPQWIDIAKQQVAHAVASGFDGAYFDWLEAYSDPSVVQAAQAEGKDPTAEIVKFAKTLVDYGHSLNPAFKFIAQNAAELGRNPDYAKLFDAVAQEHILFNGSATDPDSGKVQGDVPVAADDRAAVTADLAAWQAQGKPVFDVEYATKPENVAASYAYGAQHGYITTVASQLLDGPPVSLIGAAPAAHADVPQVG